MSNTRRIKRHKPKMPPVPTVNNEPGVSYTLTIKAMADGNVVVNGFPLNLRMGMAILAQAQLAVVEFFIKAAKEGRLDDNGMAEPSRIVVPN